MPYVLVVVAVLIAWQAIRRPMLRRLAVRDATRRPTETMLVIAGSLLGTALITGSFIVGDTLDSSIRASAYNQLGPIDEVLALNDPESAGDVERRVAAIDDPRIDGVMSLLSTRAPIASGELAEPYAQIIELDFEEGRAFGSDPAITGISGDTPRPGEVVVGEDLADVLEIETGDTVTAHVYGDELELEVVRILPQTGLAGFWIGFEASSPNAFVAPGTIAGVLRREAPEEARPPVTFVLVSNRGGVEDAAEHSSDVTGLIEETLGTTPVRVEETKRQVLESAENQGNEFQEVFLGIGSFAIIAGVLLLVNIFVMLSEERKSQLGMLRAVGMTRSHLVRVFVIEGFFYALVSGVLGTVLGIGVGWAIVKVAAPIFGGFGDFGFSLTFDVAPDSLINGFCIGVLISILTIFGTSFRISRVNIIRAIRDLPEPRLYRARLRSVVIGSLVAAAATAATVASWGNDAAWTVALLGIPITMFGLLPLMSRVVGRRVAMLISSSGTLVWGVFGNAITGGQFFDRGEIFAFVIQGTMLTLGAVLLLSQSQENLEGVIRRISARSLPLRLSVAYPLAHRARTGLTLGMFALVIFTMTFIAVLTTVFGGQVDTATKKEGDFHILATASSTNPPEEEAIESFEGVDEVAVLTFGPAFFQRQFDEEPHAWSISGVASGFVEGGPPSLSELPGGVGEDEVWQRLLDDPTTIIVPAFFLQTGGGPAAETLVPGDTIEAIDPLTGGRVEREVIGIVENDFAFSGSYSSKESVTELLGANAAPSRFYIKVDDEGSAGEVARRLQGEFVANGVEADPFRSIVEDFQRSNLQFFRLMTGYLALGLLVGIAGLGVVMVRAVRERRRDVGVLRSLGFLPYQVRRAFVLESGFVALQGILIGVVLAIVTASQLVATEAFGEDIAFIIPWDNLTILTGLALAASLAATAWPAQEASKIPPAVALRIAD
ncbi:MAG: FtsX-like permease family protein [Actinomycetota bacterium]|nr:FtsX-like permease family protein [Actinomycetota bacterium]